MALVLSSLLIAPQVRHRLFTTIVNEERTILATIPFSNGDEFYKIVKIKSGTTVSIEIYKLTASADYALMALFEIPDARDVYYDINSAPTNLFLAHLDSDGTQEIVVPTMGRNLESKLNIIKFNAQTKSFAHHSL